MDSAPCTCDDCDVMAAALRNRLDYPALADGVDLQAELARLIDVVAATAPRDQVFLSALEVARSLVMLGRPTEALARVEVLLAALRRPLVPRR
ncbi:hypothetical protein PQQ81_09705 [Paraburkholderia strydomiana]|uniref:hypothetical protein n=1 Tax=Paraburkholderia strydomiana TaxID=1245417 RepID=UPI0038B87CC5